MASLSASTIVLIYCRFWLDGVHLSHDKGMEIWLENHLMKRKIAIYTNRVALVVKIHTCQCWIYHAAIFIRPRSDHSVDLLDTQPWCICLRKYAKYAEYAKYAKYAEFAEYAKYAEHAQFVEQAKYANLPNQTYQTKPSNQTYQTKPIKLNLPNQTY